MNREGKTRGELLEELNALQRLLEHVKTQQEELRREEAARKGTPDGGNLFFDAGPQPIIVINAEGRVLSANPACAEKLGRDAGDIPGSSFDHLWPSTAAEKRRAAVREAIFTGRPVHVEDESLERFYDLTIVPDSEEPDRATKAVIFFSDATEKERISEKRSRKRN